MQRREGRGVGGLGSRVPLSIRVGTGFRGRAANSPRESSAENAALCPRPRLSPRPDQEPHAPVQSHGPGRRGCLGSCWFQPLSWPSFSPIERTAPHPSRTGRACSPPPCSTRPLCTPRPRLVLKPGSTMPARASSSAQLPRAPGRLAPCPTRGSPPSGTWTHSRGGTPGPRPATRSRLYVGQAGTRPSALSPICLGCRAGPEEAWFCLDGYAALLCPGPAREQEAALALPLCPANCIPRTGGGPVRSSSRPVQTHWPWRL